MPTLFFSSRCTLGQFLMWHFNHSAAHDSITDFKDSGQKRSRGPFPCVRPKISAEGTITCSIVDSGGCFDVPEIDLNRCHVLNLRNS